MIPSDPYSKVFHVLKHSLRRQILHLIAEEPITYTDLMHSLGVESGLLAYHLRSMEELVEKDLEGCYRLSRMGKSALNFMNNGEAMKPKSTSVSGVVSKFLIVLFITCSLLSNAYLVTSLQDFNRQREDSISSIRAETVLLAEDSLDVIYKVFEHIDVDRGLWTDLLLNAIQIRTNLYELDSITPRMELVASRRKQFSSQAS